MIFLRIFIYIFKTSIVIMVHGASISHPIHVFQSFSQLAWWNS